MLPLVVSLEHVTVSSQQRTTQSLFAHNFLPNVFFYPVFHQIDNFNTTDLIQQNMNGNPVDERKSREWARLLS